MNKNIQKMNFFLIFYKIFLCFFILNLPLTKVAMQDLGVHD